MVSIEVEYRGYTIRYSENGDEWVCYDIASGKAAAAPTLSKMKGKIDKYMLGIRKESAVTCLEIHSYGNLKFHEANVIEYLGPRLDGGAWTSRERHVSEQQVAVMAARDKERPSRQEIGLARLAPIGPETDAAIAEAQRLLVIADDANKAYAEAVKGIPRLTLADIEELVKISGLDPTGGLS